MSWIIGVYLINTYSPLQTELIYRKIPQETRSIVLATSFNISIIHGRVWTDHAPYITKIYTEHSKQEGGGRVD